MIGVISTRFQGGGERRSGLRPGVNSTVRLRITGALLGAAATAAGTMVLAGAPARAATGGLGVPSPGPISAPSLGALPTLPPTPTASPTPTPVPSTICAAPTVTGVAYTWNGAGNPAEAPWTQPSGPGGEPDQQVAEWHADTGMLTITGANLLQTGCSTTVTIGRVALPPYNPGASTASALVFSFTPATPLPAQAASAAVAPSSSVPLGKPAMPPSIASGVVRVTETDPTTAEQDSSKNPDQYVLVQDPPTATATNPAPYTVSNPSPHEGDLETISSQGGLSQFETGQPYAVPGALLYTSYGGCEGYSIPGGYTAPADTQTQPLDLDIVSGVPYAYCDGPVGLQFSFARDASHPAYCGTPPPAGTPANCEQFGVTAGLIDVSFDVSSIGPNPVAPGGTVLVTGAGFGTSGSARIDGVPLKELYWSDRAAVFKAPLQQLGGTFFLKRTQQGGDGAEKDLGHFAVQVGAPSGSSIYGGGIPLGYLTPTGVLPYVPGRIGAAGPKPPMGQQLQLALSTTKATAGDTIHYTVTLAIDGAPAAHAPITLSVVSSPGSDTKVSPASGTTNDAGALRGTIRLSANPGTTLLLARSGTFSDEATVLGVAPSAAGIGSLPFGLNIDLSGNPLVVWLSLATILLVLAGVAVNLDVLRRFLWSITIGRLIRRHRARTAGSA